MNKLSHGLIALAVFLAPVLRGQEPSSVSSLAALLKDSTISDSIILRKIQRNNIAFVPTTAHSDSLITLRPWLHDTLPRVLSETCVQGNPQLSVTTDEIVYLVKRRSIRCHDEEDLIQYVETCPRGGTYKGLRAIARSAASRALLRHLSQLCGVPIDRPKWELSIQADRSVLSAAEAVRAEQMTFGDGVGAAVKVSYSPQRIYRVAGVVDLGRHDLQSKGIDVDPAGQFTLWSLSLSARLLVSCLWNGKTCGDPLFSSGDAYLDASAGFYHLGGDMRLTADPAYLDSIGVHSTGPFGFSFNGWGIGLGAGYRWRLSKILALEAETRYSGIRFDRVSVNVSDQTIHGDVTGWSSRFSVGLSAVVLVRL